jgi:hypothetical protein
VNAARLAVTQVGATEGWVPRAAGRLAAWQRAGRLASREAPEALKSAVAVPASSDEVRASRAARAPTAALPQQDAKRLRAPEESRAARSAV